jgi:arylsulfatase A-like enzyme
MNTAFPSAKRLSLLSLTELMLGSLATLGAATPKPPNFVVILGEGHGWSSTSVPMDDAVADSKSTSIRTPNLEKFAKEGMRFSNFYAASPRCTPSRAAILTGKNPARLHMTFVGDGRRPIDGNVNGRVLSPSALMELPACEITIPECLRSSGYTTAHFGKWHLGRVAPSEHGFDESDGATDNGGPDKVMNPHPKQLDQMTEHGMDFMTREAKAGKPFYLQLSHYASRQAGGASPESLASVKSWGGNLNERQLAEAAADFDLDLAFGKLLRKLDGLGLTPNTYVIFTTDHGTPGRNPPFAGGKGTVLEGGLRVPCIVRGPGIQAGLCSHIRASDVDLLPTITALAKIAGPKPSGVDGGSLASVLTNGGKGTVIRPREEFVVHFPHYDRDTAGPASAILLGDFKLIRIYESGALRLFNITKDPGERNDLTKELPDKTKELNQRLTNYLVDVNAQMPKTNPDYDPSRPTELPEPMRGGGRRRAQP